MTTATTTTETTTILDYALNYALEWGWAVFPLHSITDEGKCTCGNADCKSPGKHPRTPNGVLDASKDEAQIRAWFDKAYDVPNIGIATGKISNLVVLDIDLAKGAHSKDLIVGGVDQTIFNTPKIKTGGGLHFYYALPQGAVIKNSASRLGQFIDVRGEGGYVVAPPSRHASGRVYEFRNNVERLLEFPAEWISRLTLPQSPAMSHANGNGNHAPDATGNGLFVPPPSSTLIVPDSINQGARNQELTRIAGSLRRIGLDQSEIEAALEKINARVCQPPLGMDEVRRIARSVSRYQPHDAVKAVTEAQDAEPDYENTLQPYLYGEFLEQTFEEKEILGFHIGKRDIAIIQAATNAGKTTLLRNVGLCMAAGRPFLPLYEGKRPVKIAYFDFENDAPDVQKDLRIMDDVFTPEEMERLKKNFIVIPKGLMGGELFQFNSHEKWAFNLIKNNEVEFVFVDNVSAAYDLNDENSNAEVTKKVIKPLLKMAYKCDSAFVFAHHYGKQKKNELEEAGVHAGRGASALQSLSKVVINMFGDVSEGLPVTIECAKRKSDGGQKYRETFKLEDDRWFHHTMIVPPPKKKTAYQAIREFFESIIYPQMIATADVIAQFESEFSVDSIKKGLNELYKDGFLEKPKHGFYCGKELSKTSAAGGEQTVKVVNFYEKDDD